MGAFDDLIPTQNQAPQPQPQVQPTQAPSGSFDDLIPAQNTRSGLLPAVADRALSVSSNLISGIGDIAEEGGDYLERKVPISGMSEQQIQQDTIRPYTEKIAQGIEGIRDKINYAPEVTWQDVKDNPLSANTAKFMLESGVAMIPDMAASMYAFPSYALSRTHEIAQSRAENDGREQNTIGDMATVAPVAVATSGLERFGVTKMLPSGVTGKNVGTRILQAGGIEAATEFAEEIAEYGAETIGTETPFDVKTAVVDRGLPGIVVGGPVGAGGRAITEVVGKSQQSGSEILQEGVSEQSIGADETPAVAAQVDAPLNRQDLQDAIENDTPLPESKTIDLPQVDIDPILQGQGLVVGAKVDQVTEDGEVFQGTVASAQEVEGELEVTIIDNNGELKTLFASDGEIGVEGNVTPEITPPVTPEVTVADAPIEENVTPPVEAQLEPQIQQLVEPAPPPPPASVQQPVRPPQKPEPQPEKSLEELTQALRYTNDQAKTNGWNKILTDNKKKVTKELNERFPEWDAPKKVEIEQAVQDVAPEPTDAQKEAGNYKKGHVSVHGFPIAIENPKGSIRSGKDKDGTDWSVEIPAHYGYIKRTEGADGDHIDVYVGDDTKSDLVVIVDQVDADSEIYRFDEHKVMMGYSDVNSAVDAYKGGFSDGKAEQRIGGITPMRIKDFKAWISQTNGKKKFPVAHKKLKPEKQEINNVENNDIEKDVAPPADQAQQDNNAPSNVAKSKPDQEPSSTEATSTSTPPTSTSNVSDAVPTPDTSANDTDVVSKTLEKPNKNKALKKKSRIQSHENKQTAMFSLRDNYNRVMPRDLFNEAKVLSMHLKLIDDYNNGRLPAGIDIRVDDESLNVGLSDNGELYLSGVEVYYDGELLSLETTYNAGKDDRFPFYVTAEGIDVWGVPIYDNDGNLDSEFTEYFDQEPVQPENVIELDGVWDDAKNYLVRQGVVGLWEADRLLPDDFVFDLHEDGKGFDIDSDGVEVVANNINAQLNGESVNFYLDKSSGELKYNYKDDDGFVISKFRDMHDDFKALISENSKDKTFVENFTSNPLFRKTEPKKSIDNSLSKDMSDKINSRLKSLGWDKANFRISNDLDSEFGVSGVDGAYWRGMIHVSMQAKDILSTINHEVVHGLKAFGAFTNSEWKTLESKSSVWRKKYNIDDTYKSVLVDQGVNDKSELERRLNEEAIAHAFQDFDNKGAVRRIANKAVKFVKAIGDVLRGNKFKMKTADDVFNAIETGEIGSRIDKNTTNDAPMYSLSKAKKPALKQATESLTKVTGLEQSMTKDIGRMNASILHPQQIAVLYKEFTGVYRSVIKRFKDREVLMNELGDKLNPYNNIKEKKNVHAALELGRFDKTTYKPDANGTITVKNIGNKNAQFSKDGDTITLTPAEANAYLKTREMFDLAFDKFFESVLEDHGLRELGAKTVQDVEKIRLQAMKSGGPKEAARFKEILQRLNDINKAKKSGYIPFKRWGEVGVSVKYKGDSVDKDGSELPFERIELSKKSKKKDNLSDATEVQKTVERLQKKYNGADYEIKYFKMSNFDESAAHIDLNEFDILTADSSLPSKDRKAIRDTIEKKMKEKGFRSHFFQSRDVPGYSDDFERAFNEYSISISSYISRRMNQSAIDEQVMKVAESGKKDLHQYAIKYVDYVNNTVEEFANIRLTNFYLFLGLNVSSGMVNLTQPFLVTAPWFKQKFSHASIAKTMTKSYADVHKYIKPSKAGWNVFDFNNAPKDVRAALLKADASGDFLSQSTNDAMGISNSTNQSLRNFDKAKRKMLEISAITFSVPEKTNRIVTFTAAYRLAMMPEGRKKIERFVKNNHLAREMLGDGKTAEDYAFAYAELAVVSTQYRVGKLNRPTIARSYGSLVFQFMSFTAQTFEAIYNIGKVQGGHNKKALGSLLFAVWAFAGIKGIPFEEDMEDLIEFVYGYLTKTDLDIDAEMRDFLTKKFGEVPAEAILKGLPAAFANMDMSQRLGFGTMIPGDASDALGVSGELYKKPKRALDALGRGEPGAAAAEILPSAFANPIKAYIWNKHGVYTRKGAKIIDNQDLTTADVGLKSIGITTSKISRTRDGIYSEKRADSAANDLRNSFYSRIAKTIVAREDLKKAGKVEDAQQMQEQLDNIFSEIRSHNETAPLHKKIKPSEYTIKRRVMQEMQGAKAIKGRKQARPRQQELKEIYNW